MSKNVQVLLRPLIHPHYSHRGGAQCFKIENGWPKVHRSIGNPVSTPWREPGNKTVPLRKTTTKSQQKPLLTIPEAQITNDVHGVLNKSTESANFLTSPNDLASIHTISNSENSSQDSSIEETETKPSNNISDPTNREKNTNSIKTKRMPPIFLSTRPEYPWRVVAK